MCWGSNEDDTPVCRTALNGTAGGGPGLRGYTPRWRSQPLTCTPPPPPTGLLPLRFWEGLDKAPLDSCIYCLYGMYRGMLVEPMAACHDKRHDSGCPLFPQAPQPRERSPKQNYVAPCHEYPKRPYCAGGVECHLGGGGGNGPSPLILFAVGARGGAA